MLGRVRIAFFAKRKRRTRTTRYIAAALERAGHPVLWVNERKRRSLLGSAGARASVRLSLRRFRPDLVLIHANDVRLATLEALAARHRTALFTPDCWPSPLRGEALELARRVDLLLTVAKGQIPEFLDAGVRRAAWLAEACEPSAHYPVEGVGAEWACDVAFVGKLNPRAAHYAHRAQLVRTVHERFETRVYGTGWEALGIEPSRAEVGPEEYRKVCAGARIVLGRDWTDACEAYFSNRTWFTLGCGGFLLTNYVPGLEEIFGNHRELVWYRSAEECCQLVDHYLARPDERRRIAAAGRAYALAHRTTDHFVRDLLDLVEGKPPAFPPPRLRA
jgi:spore maturation protein CgeB